MLTIIVPAFNEQDRVAGTVSEIVDIATATLPGFEVIVVDDGSSDRTFEAASEEAQRHPGQVRVVRQPGNRGVGAAYRLGLEQAAHPFLTLIPGDRAFQRSGIQRVFEAVGSTGMIVSYRSNPQARTPLRRQLSRLATLLVRMISGRKIRDAHSMYVFPVALARSIEVSDGYSYHLETLCRLLRKVDSFREIPVELTPKPDASSGVMRVRTMAVLGTAVLRMFWLRLLGRLG